MVIHGYRIIEIEWAVKNDKEYVPSPKPVRKPKSKKTKTRTNSENLGMDNAMDVDDHEAGEHRKDYRMGPSTNFGMEVTNTDSPSRGKRSFTDAEDFPTQTPLKKQKRVLASTPVVSVSSEDEMEPPVVARKSQQKVVL